MNEITEGKKTMAGDVVDRIIEEVRPYTMVPPEGLRLTVRLTLAAVNSGVPGSLVECGTWRGGASFAMLLAQRYVLGSIRKDVWMFDSFEGLPPAGPKDGERAKTWQEKAHGSPRHFDNCTASIAEMMEGAKALGLLPHITARRGWFQDTLPASKAEIGPIALLRIDGDWYDSVRCVLDELEPQVSTGAPVILDDYFAWPGCTLATHEYLAEHQLPWRLRSTPNQYCAWTIKSTEDVLYRPQVAA